MDNSEAGQNKKIILIAPITWTYNMNLLSFKLATPTQEPCNSRPWMNNY